MLDAALAAVPDGDSTVRARLLTRLSYENIVANPARAEDLGMEAYAMARRVGDPSTTVEATIRAAPTIWRVTSDATPRDESVLSMLEEATATAEQLGDPALLFTALFVGGQNE